MFWKGYFWAYIALAAFSLLGAVLRPSALVVTDWIDLVAFTPVAVAAVLAQAFNRSFLPTDAWRVLLFGSVFWKSIALGISIPKVMAHGVALNSTAGLIPAEIAIAAALGMAGFLVAPPLVALYCKGYPDGDLGRIRLPSPKRNRQAPAKA
jgi:hypothetical protein